MGQGDEHFGPYVTGNARLSWSAALPCKPLPKVAQEQHAPHVFLDSQVNGSGGQGLADRGR